jgi:hypothetical protein
MDATHLSRSNQPRQIPTREGPRQLAQSSSFNEVLTLFYQLLLQSAGELSVRDEQCMAALRCNTREDSAFFSGSEGILTRKGARMVGMLRIGWDSCRCVSLRFRGIWDLRSAETQDRVSIGVVSTEVLSELTVGINPEGQTEIASHCTFLLSGRSDLLSAHNRASLRRKRPYARCKKKRL